MVTRAAVLAGLIMVLVQGCAWAADAPADKTRLFPDVSGVTVISGKGHLTVTTETRDTVSAHWHGPQAWIDAWKTGQDGNTLLLDGKNLPQTDSGSVSVSGVSVFASGGGSASVNIGGTTMTAKSQETPSLDLHVPTGTRLRVLSFAGEMETDPLSSPAEITLRNGTANLSALNEGGRVVIEGAGTVTLQRAQGETTLIIAGSGNISVNQAHISHLVATIGGNGQISVSGQAKEADLTVTGAGMISVDSVTTTPRTRSSGAGMISVGNHP